MPGAGAGGAGRRRTQQRQQEAPAEHVFLMVHAKVEETNDFVQPAQVQLLGLLGRMSDGF